MSLNVASANSSGYVRRYSPCLSQTMRINRNQIEAFAKHTQQQFCERLTIYIREHFSSHLGAMSQHELLAWVHAALAVCERGGIEREPHVAQMILLLMALGLDSADRPWVEAILAEQGIASTDKLRRVIRTARESGVPAIDDVIVYDDLEEAGDG